MLVSANEFLERSINIGSSRETLKKAIEVLVDNPVTYCIPMAIGRIPFFTLHEHRRFIDITFMPEEAIEVDSKRSKDRYHIKVFELLKHMSD